MASFVPEPMEKCAVWAASPSRTVRPSDHCSQRTVRKRDQRDLLPANECPPSVAEKTFSRYRSATSSVAPASRTSMVASKPARRHVASSVSTRNVLAPVPAAEYG